MTGSSREERDQLRSFILQLRKRVLTSIEHPVRLLNEFNIAKVGDGVAFQDVRIRYDGHGR